MDKKIVDRGIKIDLHIHSVYSNCKDGKKVAKNTLENLHILVKGLKKHNVEMCAITDHDIFNYELYSTLKKEEKSSSSIKKVLPGIEFSVEFEAEKVIHIVTIFDDKDESKVKNIEKVMTQGKGKTKFKKNIGAYTKEDYFDILSEINLDFVMIAHQKKSPISLQNPHPNDVMVLGADKFNELVFMDYFDAFEFKNKRNEIYNKVYTTENNFEEKLRFLTGSDCHCWDFYPFSRENEQQNFEFTYLKSLPSFKGLAMAVTDCHRIELENNFFNPTARYIKELIVEIDGDENIIPLSKGINVIIGDNSVGKSLFLHMITKNCKKIDRRIIAGYKKYVEKKKIIFKNFIEEEDIFKFNQQGEIREIFDEDGLQPDKYLTQFYPNEIDASKYKQIVDEECGKLYESIQRKITYDAEVEKLSDFTIFLKDDMEKSIIFIENLKRIDITKLKHLVDGFNDVVVNLKSILCQSALQEDDEKYIKNMLTMIEEMSNKYIEKLEKNKLENEKINIFNTYLKNYRVKYNKRVTDEQAMYSSYVEARELAVDDIIGLLKQKQKLEHYETNIEETVIVPETNPVDEYKFVSKLQIEKIDNNYIEQLINSILKKGETIDTTSITELDLRKKIKNFPAEDEITPLQVFREKLNAKINADFKIRNTIVKENMEVYDEVSSGFDAQMYFALLSGEMRDKGIYIIDQPEDHISPKAIKENVLDNFRRMAAQRQVIMVTHNPQFIVNLDVDNVIFLSKQKDDFTIQSGALEYENEDYSILKIVAENIEGGLTTIQGRMKRYEKNI